MKSTLSIDPDGFMRNDQIKKITKPQFTVNPKRIEQEGINNVNRDYKCF